MDWINFLYEISEDNWLIWYLEWNKLKNKRYFFWSLDKIDFSDNVAIYLSDSKFDYKQKQIIWDYDEKIKLSDIEKELKLFSFKDSIFLWYNISNIIVDDKISSILLWKEWKINYTLWIYWLNKLHYNNLLQIFWKNININVYPNSFWTVKEFWINFLHGNLIYFLRNRVKLITIKNWFYENINSLDIWISFLNNRINEIYWKQLDNINELSDFHKKIYFKELNNYLEPIINFLKFNLINDNIFIIWNFNNLPNFLDTISSKLNKVIVPFKVDNKNFKTMEEVDIYNILKYGR